MCNKHCDVEGAWQPVCACDCRDNSTENHSVPSDRWEPVSPVPEESWPLPRHQYPCVVPVELISGCLDCTLEFGELGFPLDLTGTK